MGLRNLRRTRRYAAYGRRDDTRDLNATLARIEGELDAGSYRPGPWAEFLGVARRRSRATRLALAPDVTRVSDKLHRRKHSTRFPFSIGLVLAVIGTVVGVALLQLGLARAHTGLAIASSVVLTVTLQPPIKLAVGYLLGIRYSHFFFFGLEPRFKMRYGTYLSAERWRRVLLHLSGTVGSPLAFWWVALRTEEALPGASATCRTLFLLLAAVQVLTFSLGIAGVRRLGPLGAVRHTSGGAAAYELREAMTKNGMEPDSV
jgi:hypothetical protein